MTTGRSSLRNTTHRRFIRAAVWATALTGATAMAHHEGAADRGYLAFWAGYRTVSDPLPTPEACRDGLYWAKGFVSIYAHGAE